MLVLTRWSLYAYLALLNVSRPQKCQANRIQEFTADFHRAKAWGPHVGLGSRSKIQHQCWHSRRLLLLSVFLAMKSTNVPLLNLCPVWKLSHQTELYLVRVSRFESKYSSPIYLSGFIIYLRPRLHWHSFNGHCFTRNHANPDTAVLTTLILKRNMLFLQRSSGMKWPQVSLFLINLEVGKCDERPRAVLSFTKEGACSVSHFVSDEGWPEFLSTVPQARPRCPLHLALDMQRRLPPRGGMLPSRHAHSSLKVEKYGKVWLLAMATLYS